MYDVAVVGAGVVGSAIAREIATRHPWLRVIVFEKHAEVGLEASSRNSGVLHSGIHGDPRLLKTQLALEGSVLAQDFAERHGVPMIAPGMLIAIPGDALVRGLLREGSTLYWFLRNASALHIKTSWVGPRGVRQLEPALHAKAGIFVPEVRVVDSWEFVRALVQSARERGVDFRCATPVGSFTRLPRGEGWVISAGNFEFLARLVVNAAGVSADEIAVRAGFGRYQGITQPVAGEYLEASEGVRGLVRHLVYPAVAPKGSASKGIHFGPRPDGRLFVGPNAVPLTSRVPVDWPALDLESLYAATRAFLPDCKDSDFWFSHRGIRAKLGADRSNGDFIVRMDDRENPFVNVIGIDSPGFAASLALARYVRAMCEEVV